MKIKLKSISLECKAKNCYYNRNDVCIRHIVTITKNGKCVCLL